MDDGGWGGRSQGLSISQLHTGSMCFIVARWLISLETRAQERGERTRKTPQSLIDWMVKLWYSAELCRPILAPSRSRSPDSSLWELHQSRQRHYLRSLCEVEALSLPCHLLQPISSLKAECLFCDHLMLLTKCIALCILFHNFKRIIFIYTLVILDM